jgi:organic radical activating enzyme
MLLNTIEILIKRFVRKEILYWVTSKILLRPENFLRFQVLLTHHCNLNCAGCSVFSPIAEEKFLDTACYEQDCKRLYELTNGKVKYVKLIGGEPLLHPNLLDFFDITRRYFINAKIYLNTNGILLCKQDNDFWENCKKNNINIIISKYPIKLNMDEIFEKCKSYHVVLETTESKTDEMFHLKFDVEGKQNAEEQFYNCWMKNLCTTLSHGRLYTCSSIPTIEHFNRYFNLQLMAKDSDSIDIYKAENIKEILKFLCRPVSFCRYCDIKGMSYRHKWHISKKDINEWI